MVTILLLIVIYIAFIGLGIPDSLFGTAWPAIYSEYGFPLSFGSFVTVIISSCTALSSIMSARLINRWGTSRVTLYSTALTAVAILGISYTGNFVYLCLCAIPLGLGAGSIDTALNNYVALHYLSSQMSFLHCFYGIGVTVSPYVLSVMINSPLGWRGGYRIAFYIQAAITLTVLISMPLWRKSLQLERRQESPDDTGQTVHEESINELSLKQVAAIPGVKLMWCMFLASVAIEMTAGGWGSTFLVENKGLAPDRAASTIMFYFVGIAVGRFLSGVFAGKLGEWRIIGIGMTILGIALISLLLAPTTLMATISLFLIGLGNGPLFPNFNYLTPQNFGKENSPAVIGTQMAVASLSMMITPVFCGLIGQWLGMWIFPLYLLLFYLLLISCTIGLRKVLTH